jgi:regulator of sigma E protease
VPDLTVTSPGILMTIVSFLLVIGPLIFIHELGHYFVGRWCGVKAEAFSIGFGREIAGWTDRRGTRWKVGWLPLGGYVKFKGDMNPASTPSDEWLMLPPEERAETFQAKSVWQRFIIVAAGPITNFLFAILVYVAVFASFGEPRTPPIVAGVEQGSAADSAGFAPGDTIVSINGERVSRFEDIATFVRIRPGERLAFEIVRGGETLKVQAVPRENVERDEFGNEARLGRLGIAPAAQVIVPLAPGEVVGAALQQTSDTVKMMVVTLGQVITGTRSVKEMGGPLKIAQISGQQATLGWIDFVWFMSLISINLGFINLLPIPLLDGGHLAFYAIEAVRRKPLKPEAQEWAFRTGLAALLALMIFVTLNDLASFGVWAKLGGLIG